MSRALRRVCVLLIAAVGIGSGFLILNDNQVSEQRHAKTPGFEEVHKVVKSAQQPLLGPKSIEFKPEIKPAKVEISNLATEKIHAEIPPSEAKLFAESKSEVDFKIIAEQLRIFKEYHDQSFNGFKMTPQKTEFLTKMETELFSWIKPSFKSTVAMRKSFNGNGIVICAGNGAANLAISTLRMIREIHQSDLPVEVFYIGDNDLSPESRKKFEKIPFTTTRDITKIFDDEIMKLGGWAIKGFALLASSFKNAMLIDADVVFIQSPETLFSSYLFKTYGALFFHDRSLYSQSENTKKWFKDIMPQPQSDYSKTFRIFQDKTGHEQESGVVLINKEASLPGLLATCTLNVDKIRNLAYEFVYGDKETFWLGFEMVSQSYRFNGFFPGTIGEPKKKGGSKTEICGRQLMHVDEQRVPSWINGGIAESKVISTNLT
jgi:Mannosyltransferase putative